LKILKKDGSDLLVIASRSENVRRGDYLIIFDDIDSNQLIVQIYDETYLDNPGSTEEIIRGEILQIKGIDEDPVDLDSMLTLLKDLRVLKCRSRGTLLNGKHIPHSEWLPSRASSTVMKIPLPKLISSKNSSFPLEIGSTYDDEAITIPGEAFDASINIITGKKGTGKSHLAKVLMANLVSIKANTMVFDVNGEYENLTRRKDGGPSELNNKVIVLKPGENLKFSLSYLGKNALTDVFLHTLDTNYNTVREFSRIYDLLVSQKSVNLKSLRDTISGFNCNDRVKEALISRYDSLISTNIFSDNYDDCLRIEDEFNNQKDGIILIISLKNSSSFVRKLIVELMLSKITQLLEFGIIRPLLLFAEEAHLYLKDTFWDDIVTRMRHLGIFTTFITNQPDSINESIRRQVDNIFLFNLVNDSDLDAISRISVADSDTIKSIVKTLPKGYCLAVGKVVSELPSVLKITDPNLITSGISKSFLFPEL